MKLKTAATPKWPFQWPRGTQFGLENLLSQIISFFFFFFLHPDLHRKLKIYLQKISSETRSKSCSRSKKQGLRKNIIPQNIFFLQLTTSWIFSFLRATKVIFTYISHLLGRRSFLLQLFATSHWRYLFINQEDSEKLFQTLKVSVLVYLHLNKWM